MFIEKILKKNAVIYATKSAAGTSILNSIYREVGKMISEKLNFQLYSERLPEKCKEYI